MAANTETESPDPERVTDRSVYDRGDGYPRLQFDGADLEVAGFDVGDTAKVCVYENEIVIRHS